MASLRSLQAYCDQMNEINRMATTSKKSLSLSEFWDEATSKSFLINIANDLLRARALCLAVRSINLRDNSPIIIINQNPYLENELIGYAQNGLIGLMHSSSERFPGYNLFTYFSVEKIIQLMCDLAEENHYSNLDQFSQYAGAFLRVLQQYYPLNYNAMLAQAKRSDAEIAALARKAKASQYDIDIIAGTPQASGFFREMLLKYGIAFKTICTTETTDYCLAGIGSEQAIHLIWGVSTFQSCFNREIAEELKHLVANGVRFNLIFSDVNFSANDPLLAFIKEYGFLSGIFGISTADAVMTDGSASGVANGICGALGSRLIIPTRGASATSLESVLGMFGDYTHYEVAKGLGVERSLFPHPFSGTDNYQIVNDVRPRVRFADTVSHPVVAYGHMGSYIGLYKSYDTEP